MSAPALFPRHIAVLILVLLACAFAGNHIAARIAFDHDTGLLKTARQVLRGVCHDLRDAPLDLTGAGNWRGSYPVPKTLGHDTRQAATVSRSALQRRSEPTCPLAVLRRASAIH